MKVLIACEYSGTVRSEFEKLGHDAWSCDILPSDIPGKHYQGSVLDILNDGWDLMIGHPPCTYLSFAGNRVWYTSGRAQKRLDALDFFLRLWESPINQICLENPMGIVDRVIEKHTQIVHPYYFGDREMKKTCLWLKNLPKLIHIKESDLFSQITHSEKPDPQFELVSKEGKIKKEYFTYCKTAHERSKTFPGIAKAMAEQWGGNIQGY